MVMTGMFLAEASKTGDELSLMDDIIISEMPAVRSYDSALEKTKNETTTC